MRFPHWLEGKRTVASCGVLASACLLTAFSCRAQVTSNSPSDPAQTAGPSLVAEEARSNLPKMHVASSMPLPDVWKKMGNADRIGCSQAGDLLFQLVPGDLADMSHEIARVAANGAMLGYFDLRQTPGFEKAAIQQATFDSEGRIVLLVMNLLSSDVMRTDAEGRPHSIRFHADHTRWVLTVDDNGKILTKFSFKDSVVTGQGFALFNNGNVLVTGFVDQWQGGVIFSSDGAVLGKLKVPALEPEWATANERPATAAAKPSGAAERVAGGGAAAAAVRRPQISPRTVVPIANGEGEVFLVQIGDDGFLLKVSADGTTGPKVKLAVPEDERAYVERIAGRRVLAAIYSAQRLPPGTITKAPDWTPKAVFDTESGALLETLLMSRGENGPVCYSGSGMKAIRVPEGTLDSLEK